MRRLLYSLIILLLGISSSGVIFAADFDIDAYVARVQKAFNVPGVAIGIIHDGKVVIGRGYGITDLENPRPVDAQSIFKIASNTKAFTATALAMLVDEQKLTWQDKVRTHLPAFRLYDDYASENFTPIDLLTHRSGLGLGAGDLMLWPEPTNFTRAELVKNLRYLKPVYGFRAQYAYDNTLYIVAGELIAVISGMTWEEFIHNRIFKPLNMQRCFAGGINTKETNNVTAPHLLLNDELKVDTPNRLRSNTTLMAAAGGIKCSLGDLLTWIQVVLDGGEINPGKRLYSERQAKLLWTGVTPMRVYEEDRIRDETHFRSYALGWRLKDYHGLWQVSHTGTLSGTMSEITLYPEEDFAVIVLLNQSSGYARAALTRGIVQEFLDVPKRDWVQFYLDHQAQQQALKAAADVNDQTLRLPAEVTLGATDTIRARLGSYIDPWFGEITLAVIDGHVEFRAAKVPRLKGRVYAYDENTWWVKWHDRSFRADAWLNFSSENGETELRMNRILKKSDWSFNFQDLLFTPVKRLTKKAPR